MIILGFDCGVTGAVGALRGDGSYIDCEDLPVCRYHSAGWIDGVELLKLVRRLRGAERQVTAVVEYIHAMPDMGSIANNSKGMTLGSTLATLQIAGCAIRPVIPTVWKRSMGLLAPKASDEEKKALSLAVARKMFPQAPLELKGHHNRAEALLIAKYGQQKAAQLQLEVA